MISTKRKGDPEALSVREAWLNDVDIENGVPPRFGPELLDEVILDPTINIFLDKSPKLLISKDYPEMVKRLHYQRAQFITAEQKRKEPKIEGEE